MIENDNQFSTQSSNQLPNNIDNETVFILMKEKVIGYFWKPNHFEENMEIISLDRWNVPIWRIRGEASARWIKRIKEIKKEVVGETTVEKTEYKDVPEHKSYELEWAVAAHNPKCPELRAISEAIDSSNLGNLAIGVDWQGNIWGNIMEKLWPGIHGGLRNNLRVWIKGFGKPPILGIAKNLFLKSESIVSDESGSSRLKFNDLRPELSFAQAKDHVKALVMGYLRSSAYGSGKEVRNFDPIIDFYYNDQYWLPLWVIKYKFQNENYFAVINGYSSFPIRIVIPPSIRAGIIAWVSVTSILYLIYSPIFVVIIFNHSILSSDFNVLSLYIYILYIFLLLMPLIITTFPVILWFLKRLWISVSKS